MRAKFVRGEDPYKSIGIGKHRLVKKDEPIEVNYKGKKLQCIALEDEEVDTQAERNFIEFMDGEGGICWAVRDINTGEWMVPSANESINFERGQEPKKSMKIGQSREIKKGDRFLVKNYYDGKMHEVTALSDEYETTDWSSDDSDWRDETEVEIQFDNYAGSTYAYKGNDGIWHLGEE